MINWTFVKTLNINLRNIYQPYDISIIMNNQKVRKYLYRIKWKNVVIKFGMSFDNSRNCGERVYRQLGHCKSWGTQRLNGSSGSDWRVIEDDFYNLYGFHMDHRDIELTIYDFTDYPFVTANEWSELNSMEIHLINSYTKLVGSKPIGNVHDDENFVKKASPLKAVLEDLFKFG